MFTLHDTLYSEPYILLHVQMLKIPVDTSVCVCVYECKRQIVLSPTGLPNIVFKAISTLAYQNLLFCRVPINSILGFIIRTYKNVGFCSLR